MPPLQVQVTRPEGWWTVTVHMAERDRVKAEAAAGNISAFLRNAATIFDMINTGISSGFFHDDRYIAALTETCARAFENMADKEPTASREPPQPANTTRYHLMPDGSAVVLPSPALQPNSGHCRTKKDNTEEAQV